MSDLVQAVMQHDRSIIAGEFALGVGLTSRELLFLVAGPSDIFFRRGGYATWSTHQVTASIHVPQLVVGPARVLALPDAVVAAVQADLGRAADCYGPHTVAGVVKHTRDLVQEGLTAIDSPSTGVAAILGLRDISFLMDHLVAMGSQAFISTHLRRRRISAACN